MNKLDSRLLLITALLLVVNSGIIFGAPNPSDENNKSITDIKKGTSPANTIKIDTLCRYGGGINLAGTHIFQSEAQLTSFLSSTGYPRAESYSTTKKMSHQPDFKKWTYFAFVERWEYTIDISDGKDTLIINQIFTPISSPSGGVVAPPPYGVVVYFIPYTKKVIKFTKK